MDTAHNNEYKKPHSQNLKNKIDEKIETVENIEDDKENNRTYKQEEKWATFTYAGNNTGGITKTFKDTGQKITINTSKRSDTENKNN